MRKWLLYVLLGFLIVIIAVILILPVILPLGVIKDFATSKMKEVLHRDVKVESVSFNIFTGLKLKGLYIGNRAPFSREVFILADAIELRYDFLSLLRFKLLINKIALVKPQILIERAEDGKFNFSDLIPAPAPKKPKPAKTQKTKAPISFYISKFSILNGSLTYLEHARGGTTKSGFKDLNVDISGISLTGLPMTVKTSLKGIYQGKLIPISLSGKISANLEKEEIKASSLNLSAADEGLGINADIKGFTAPYIKADLYSKALAIDSFLSMLQGAGKEKATKKKAVYGELTRTVNKATKSIPGPLKLDVSIDMKNVSYLKLNMDELKGKLSLAKKILKFNAQASAYKGNLSANGEADLNVSGVAYSADKIELKGFDATGATNDFIDSFPKLLPGFGELKDKISGKLSLIAKLSGMGVEGQDILSNLKGTSAITLKEGKISRIKSLEGIADKIGLSMLKKDLKVAELKAEASIGKKILNVKSLDVKDTDVQVAFKGGLDLGKMQYVRGNVLTLFLSPDSTAGLSEDYSVFRDKRGWLTLDFELTGSLSKPIPIPKFEKATEKAVEKVKKQVEEKAKEELKKEGEKKLKEIFKLQ